MTIPVTIYRTVNALALLGSISGMVSGWGCGPVLPSSAITKDSGMELIVHTQTTIMYITDFFHIIFMCLGSGLTKASVPDPFSWAGLWRDSMSQPHPQNLETTFL